MAAAITPETSTPAAINSLTATPPTTPPLNFKKLLLEIKRAMVNFLLLFTCYGKWQNPGIFQGSVDQSLE
jgi:hypothetical protein